MAKWTRSVVGGVVLTVVGVVAAATWLSPRPGARLIRALFDAGAQRTAAELEKHGPPDVRILTEQYRAGDPLALLDIHHASVGREACPVIMWVHGGAWLSGSRVDASEYFDLLTGAGVAVVALDYRLAPSATYPSALIDVCDALVFLRDNADRLDLDPTRLVLAGDSAGAQIVSQIATQITSENYAQLLGRPAPIPPEWLRGVVLHCGFYDLVSFAERGRLAPVPFLRWGVGTILWAYTGRRHPDPAQLDEMSAMAHATADFPRVFITGGNADPLTDSHSRPFADRLANMGVSIESIFFDSDHDPALGHEYQFDLDGADARDVLARTIQFLVSATN